jgi:3D (Asp-Asp-Asp) domain-containing protein
LKKFFKSLGLIGVLVVMLCLSMLPLKFNQNFVTNGNSLSDDAGFETRIGMRYETNQTILNNTYENIKNKISQEITKQTTNKGSSTSFAIEQIELHNNIVENIGIEDIYIEEVPKTILSVNSSQSSQSGNKTENKKPDKTIEDIVQTAPDSNIIHMFNQNDENVEFMGNFKLTAYCPCTICCGKYGENRPKDEEGNIIVYTASGTRAQANQTIAVDPTHIPYGTTVIIKIGSKYYKYLAQDCGGAIKNQRIDVYFDTHESACDFGSKHGDVWIIKNSNFDTFNKD